MVDASLTARTGAPEWALELIRTVCAAAGAPLPLLRWRRADRPHASGVTRPEAGSIAVTAGADEVDARMTLLHELAHWVVPRSPERRGRRRRVAHHDRAFYAVALGLYERHGLAMPDALAREAARYPSALRHAVALGIPGAAAALASRRSAQPSRRAGQWRVLVAEHPVVVRREGRWWVCATCGHRIVGRLLVRARRRAGRERHVLWTREPAAAEAV